MNSRLGGYIATEVDEIEEIQLSSIVDVELIGVDYSFIGESANGIYAVLKTSNNNVIEELDKYFSEQSCFE